MFSDDHDLAYWPPNLDPATETQNAARVLVIGPTDDEIVRHVESLHAGEIRVAAPPSARRKLHDGTYRIREAEGTVLLVVRGANAPTAASSVDSGYARGHHAAAFDMYEDHWGVAAAFVGASQFVPGDVVRVTAQGEIGSVTSVRRRPGGHTITVDIMGEIRQFSEEDLEPLDGDPRTPEFWLTHPPVSAELISRTLSWVKLSHPLSDFLYSFAATRTVFKPYQFLPALKVLSGSTGRLLIADEVGLGKTIEAGLIWTELEQRSPIRRGLIVVPSALTIKWQREMRNRFMRPLPILTKPMLAEFVADLQDGRDPALLGIVSLESLRNYREILEELVTLRPRFDIAIVDEAHSLRNRGTRTAIVGDLLSDLADHLLLLSATPLNLGSLDLFNLMHLLDADAFPDAAVFEAQLEPNRLLNRVARVAVDPNGRSKTTALAHLDQVEDLEHGAALTRRSEFQRLRAVLTDSSPFDAEQIASVKRLTSDLNTLSSVLNRTRKIDVQEKKALRVVENVSVEWSPAERALYEEIERFYMERARRSRMPLGFVMQMPLRQATSCLPVAQQRLLAKQGWLGDDERDSTYWDVSNDIRAQLDDDVEAPGWSGNTTSISRDSKLDALRARLRQLRDGEGMGGAGVMPQVLIFSFFRGTVEYLAGQLGREFRTGHLHGGVPMGDRDRVIERFRTGDFEILIANQVGSEGLDFQFCNVLVNYDLPWNPMQVEQRIGRLDRIGQLSEKIFIFNMSIPGTIETDIIGRLYTRINVFEESIGDLEPIMRQTMDEIERTVLNPDLTPEQREVELDRQAQVIEHNRKDLERIEENSGLLASVGAVEIDGLTDTGPASGRYVGASEVRQLSDFVVRKYGGRLSAEKGGVAQLTGTAKLAHALVQAVGNSTAGTRHGSDLFRMVRDGETFPVSFRPMDDDRADLISARHPIVKLALQELESEPLARPQFGAVSIGESGTRCLAIVSLVEARGLTETRELWVTAVDMSTLRRDEGVEERILVGLAEGTLGEPPATSPANMLRNHVNSARRVEDERVAEARLVRAADNEALVDARIASQEHTLRVKIANEERILSELRAKRGDHRIVRMHEGRLRGLQAELEAVRPGLERRRRLVLSTAPVAILDVYV